MKTEYVIPESRLDKIIKTGFSLGLIVAAVSNAHAADVHVPGNHRTDVVEVRQDDNVLSFMETDTRYFCHLYQEGVMNPMINSVSFQSGNIVSGGGIAADVRTLPEVPTFENNPEQFVSVQSNEAGFQTLPISVNSVDPNNPQAANVRISCCGTEARGKYNTNATPFNFLELISSYEGGEIKVRVQLYSFSNANTPIAETAVDVPSNGRVDVAIHDLLRAAGVGGADFGSVRVIHDGPAGLFESFVSLYDANLTLRQTTKLGFPECGL